MESLALFLGIYLLVGAFTGVLAGLFGVGGGTIIVPALIVTLRVQQVSEGVLTHTAIGTSLAIITITAVASTRAHHQRGAVDWSVFRVITPGICVGVWFGAAFASELSGWVLQKGFGIFLILVALQMWFGWQPHRDGDQVVLPGTPGMFGAGGIIGLLSALFGIGGGSLSVPFLSWCNLKMQQAVATAAAIGMPIALVGALSYAWQGWGHADLPAGSTGFIYWPAFIGIAAASTLSARFGARLAHTLDAQTLKKIFAFFMVVVGVYFLIK